MTEIWKQIKNEPGYEVSSLGRVRSYRVKGYNRQFNARPLYRKVDISYWGYPEVRLFVGGTSKKYRIHRLVAEAFLPNVETKQEVNHIDGDKTNNAVGNLEWVTRSENMEHVFRILKKPTMRGGRNGRARLKDHDVQSIKELWVTGKVRQKDLASKFHVARSTINAIVNNYNWKHLQPS